MISILPMFHTVRMPTAATLARSSSLAPSLSSAAAADCVATTLLPKLHARPSFSPNLRASVPRRSRPRKRLARPLPSLSYSLPTYSSSEAPPGKSAIRRASSASPSAHSPALSPFSPSTNGVTRSTRLPARMPMRCSEWYCAYSLRSCCVASVCRCSTRLLSKMDRSPKTVLKRSPPNISRSIAWTVAALASWLPSGDRPVLPCLSYILRLSGSLSTAYASPTCLNISSASGALFLSGWYFIAILRYAFLIAAASASGASPSVS
mmetsp:Transcript_46435/g.117572  ORF Transcript_46435/g.117572 Transcript_46435/m.117572 type:complete len:264 (+) Transcript_46435:431-1222(+)